MMFHTVTIFTVLISLVFLLFYFDVGGKHERQLRDPVGIRRWEGVEISKK